jgi:hypothetical protein
VTSSTAARRFRPLAACVLALLLAGAAEAVIRTGHSFWLSLALSIAAAAVFVPGAFPLPASTGEPDSRGRRHPWAFDLCLAASLIACGVGLRALSGEREATAGIWWIASSLLVLLAALFAGKRFDIPARWSRTRFPATRAGRLAVIAAFDRPLSSTPAAPSRIPWPSRRSIRPSPWVTRRWRPSPGGGRSCAR